MLQEPASVNKFGDGSLGQRAAVAHIQTLNVGAVSVNVLNRHDSDVRVRTIHANNFLLVLKNEGFNKVIICGGTSTEVKVDIPII